ncbi:hypothetical protein BDW69DRAFT_182244 [Aspergillus filifer]
MRFLLFLLPFVAPRVFADSDARKNALDARGKIEGSGHNKRLASLASVLSSLVEAGREGRELEDGADGTGEGSSGLENPENLNNQKILSSKEKLAEFPDEGDSLTQIQNLATIASGLFALVDKQRGGDSWALERGNAQGGKGSDVDQNVDIESFNFLRSIGALRQVMNLASGIEKLADGELEGVNLDIAKEGAQEQRQTPQPPPTPSSTTAKPLSSNNPKKQTAEKQWTAKNPSTSPPSSTPKPAHQPDFLAHLDAIQRFTKLAQKVTVLSNINPSAAYSERLKVIFSDPEVTSILSYIFENAHKLLTPEVLNLLRTFLRTSPVIPDEYRSLSITIADSLNAIFSPDFARHFASAKETLDDVGIDLLPALETLWDFGNWAMHTFNAESINSMSRQVALWRKALTSDEMGVFVEWISDPVTVRSLTDRVSDVKGALTAERIHALNRLFEKQGILKMENEEYQAFGSVLGERLRWYLSTQEGLAELQVVVDMLNELHHSHALVYLPQALLSRVGALTPDIADSVNHLSIHLTALFSTNALPQIATTVQDIINLMGPLLDPSTRADIVLSWPLWADLNLVLNRVYATPGPTFREIQGILVALQSLLQADNGQQFRRLIRDPVQAGVYVAPGLLVPVNLVGAQNVSAVVTTGLELELGMGDLGMTPVVSWESGHVSWMLDALYPRLEPGRVEETREGIRVLTEVDIFLYTETSHIANSSKVISFFITVMDIFRTAPSLSSEPDGAGIT